MNSTKFVLSVEDGQDGHEYDITGVVNWAYRGVEQGQHSFDPAGVEVFDVCRDGEHFLWKDIPLSTRLHLEDRAVEEAEDPNPYEDDYDPI